MFIIKLIIKWIALSVAVVLAANIIPGITVVSWQVALVVGLVLGFINIFIKPVLTLLTIPITILSLGLFSLVLNALLFWGATYFVNGFGISSFMAALLGSLLVSFVTWLVGLFLD